MDYAILLQRDRLALGNIGMTDRIFHKHILRGRRSKHAAAGPVRASSGNIFFPEKQFEKDIEQNAENNQP